MTPRIIVLLKSYATQCSWYKHKNSTLNLPTGMKALNKYLLCYHCFISFKRKFAIFYHLNFLGSWVGYTRLVNTTIEILKYILTKYKKNQVTSCLIEQHLTDWLFIPTKTMT